MVRTTVLVALVLLVIFESTFVQSWWWRRRRRRTNCNYPKTRQGNFATSSDYFYGDTSLGWWGKKSKRGKIVSNTWRLRHSLLLFRGTIFEWGIKRSGVKTYDMSRSLGDCKISWTYSRKGESRCLLSDAQTWTKAYRRHYGGYKLFSNNCHHFVNRLGTYLKTDCGRWSCHVTNLRTRFL